MKILSATAILGDMDTSKKLEYLGHRLVRHYGCYACHDGIRDTDPDPNPPEPAPEGRIAYFDTAQPIGAELNKWGFKDSDKLDFGAWGHQHDGSVAIPHSRYAWAEAKLSDTRRFDVLPVAKSVGHGKRVFVTSDRLLQKKPDELLRMPLFPFADDPEQVEAVVNYVISLVDDPVKPQKKKNLDDREYVLEAGSRLIQKLNCSGCHRLGDSTKYVHVDDLPNPNGLSDEDARLNVMEPEVWLARHTRLVARPKGEYKDKLLGIPLPASFPLSGQVGQYVDPDPEVNAKVPQIISDAEDPMSVVDVARRHFDPLPGFIADFSRALGAVVEVEQAVADAESAEDKQAARTDTEEGLIVYKPLYEWVRDRVKSSGLDPTTVLVKRFYDAFPKDDNPGPPLTEFLYAMTEGDAYTKDLESLFATPDIDKGSFEQVALAFYGIKELPFTAHDERKLAVHGFQEGGIRFYFGADATQRYKAPPPLLRQGDRVYSDWFFHFLLNVEPIRPWLTVRMPSFRLSQEEARLIVKWFKAVNEKPYGDEIFPVDTLDRSVADTGRLLFGKGNDTVAGKECSSCHPRGADLPSLPLLETGKGTIDPKEVPLHAPGDSDFLVWKDTNGNVFVEGGYSSTADAKTAGEARFTDSNAVWAVGARWDKSGWGPDLQKAAARLRPQWMRDWLYYPNDLMPGTKMPAFWNPDGRAKFRGKADAHIAPGDKQQVDALLQYLKHMNTIDVAAAPPSGDGSTGGGGGN